MQDYSRRYHYQNKIKWDIDDTIIYRNIDSQYIEVNHLDDQHKFIQFTDKFKFENLNNTLSFSKLANIIIDNNTIKNTLNSNNSKLIIHDNTQNKINWKFQILKNNFYLTILLKSDKSLFSNFIIDLQHLFPALNKITIYDCHVSNCNFEFNSEYKSKIYSMSMEDIYVYNYQYFAYLLKQNKFVLPCLPKIHNKYNQIIMTFDLNKIQYIFNKVNNQISTFMSKIILPDVIPIVCKYVNIANNINIYCHKTDLTENKYSLCVGYMTMKTKIILLKPNTISTSLNIEDYTLGDQLLFMFYSKTTYKPMQFLSIFKYLTIQYNNEKITCDAFELHTMYNMKNSMKNHKNVYPIPIKLKKYTYVVDMNYFIKNQFLFEDRSDKSVNFVTFTFHYNPFIGKNNCYLYMISPYNTSQA